MSDDPTQTAAVSELAHRALRGDEAAFLELYDRLARRLHGTALRLLGNREEAEDVIQETFITFLDKAATDPPANPGGWLHRVAVNQCLDRLRRRQRYPEDAIEAAPEGAAPPSRGLRLDLERAVAALPDGAREVLLLHDVEGLKHREIAEQLGISIGGSKSQLFRARALVRTTLEPTPPEAGGAA